MGLKYYLQHDSRDCGATCLAMIANYYHKNLSVSKARVYTKTDKNGCNLYGLVDAAQMISLKGDAMSGSPEELMDSIGKGEINFPFVAHIISDEGLLHYVVVYKIKNGKFIIGDPGKGKVILSFEDFFGIWTGYIVNFEKEADFKPDKNDGFKILQLFRLIDIKEARLGITILLSVLVAAIGVAGSFVFKLILDNEFMDKNYDKLPIIFLAVIGLYILLAVIEIAKGRIISMTSKKIDVSLSTGYFKHLLKLPVFELGKWQTGEYISRLGDISVIRNALATGLVSVVLDVSMLIVCGIMLINLNLPMFVVSFTIVLLYLILTLSMKRPIEVISRDSMSKSAIFQSLFKEVVDGIQTVKMTDSTLFIDEGTQKYEEFGEADKKNNFIGITQDALAGLIELIGVAIVLWIGFVFVHNNRMSIGDLLTFYALMGYFISPCKSLVGLHPAVQSALIAVERLNDMMDVDIENDDSGKPLPANVNKWEMKNIDFRYGNNQLTLKDINLFVEKGEKIALVGESGCGKTSIAKLFMRFYLQESGKILIDGEEYGEFSVESLRKSISYIGQDSYLFSKTLKENMILGNTDISDEEFIKVCEKCNISDFAERLPAKYDTPIDENGMNLSSGQRQRVVIGRALLRHPQLLILDEATSNLDAATEQSITNTVNELGNDVACIIIAHRLSTVEKCDRIYVVKDGSIVDVGTHAELSQNSEEYRRLLQSQ